MKEHLVRILMAGQFPESPPIAIGGVQSVTWQLARALSARTDIELHFSTVEKWWQEPEGRRWRRIHASIPVQYTQSPKRIPHVITSVAQDASAVLRDISDIKPELVHAHGQVGYTVAAIRSGLPNVVTVHGILRHEKSPATSDLAAPARWLRQQAWHRLEDWCLAKAQHIVVISPYVAEQIQPYTDAKLHTIPNPIGHEYYHVERQPNPSPTILAVGWLTARKRQHLLIRALADIRETVPNAILRVVGDSPPYESQYAADLRRLTQRLGLTDSVVFTGSLDAEALLAEYARATILGHAASEESSPMVIAQALAAGLPVVAMDIGGVRHMVDSSTGARVPEDVEGAFAETCSRLLLDHDALAAKGAAARIRAHAYREDNVADQTARMYESILR